MNVSIPDSNTIAESLRHSTDQTSRDLEKNLHLILSNSLYHQNSAQIFQLDNHENQSRLRNHPEFSNKRLLLYPDDLAKVIWDVLIFL